ncbi:LOW QUALITY PROTEIN: transmembrane protein 230-like [Panthera leo]|uniref:LOW QUALITY PROTEIN: transmembrane protein 230-like n=1 Tax=Panthera leo TaxID=9689 RepID=UPI001C69B91D|nr:LOW QUALITY PROTEIN: transmembrane protein 230-like [Panthera leo]
MQVDIWKKSDPADGTSSSNPECNLYSWKHELRTATSADCGKCAAVKLGYKDSHFVLSVLFTLAILPVYCIVETYISELKASIAVSACYDALSYILAAGILNTKVKYSRLSSTDNGHIDLQFKKSPPGIPYKVIMLATALVWIGAFLIAIGSLLLVGYISESGEWGEGKQACPVLILGTLVLLPEFYHLRMAYYASKGYQGYPYDDIPDFDE